MYCDCCPDKENLAVKTCMKCEVSLCNEHVKAHLERPAFADHPLVKPLLEILKRKCPVHRDEVMRKYCKESKSYVCNLCTMESKQQNMVNKMVSLVIQTRLSVSFSPFLSLESSLKYISLDISFDLRAGGGGKELFL